MNGERDKVKHAEMDGNSRRFSVSELFVYVSAVCVALGTIRLGFVFDESLPGPGMSFVIVIVSLCTISLLGASIGVPVALLVTGRRGLLTGAVLGAVGLTALGFIAIVITVANTHR